MSGAGRPAAFLDRDGTIIVEKHYLSDPMGVELAPGAAQGLTRLRQCGYALVLVTNQSGIGRGLLTMADFEAVQARLVEVLAAAGIRLDGVYMCPHHPAFTGPCSCRKPGLALFLEAAETLGLALGSSVWVGDRMRDVEPALALGGRGWLVGTRRLALRGTPPPGLSVAADLAAAAAAICKG